jgi:hypothetical protein
LELLFGASLLLDGPYALFDSLRVEGYVREADDDLPDLAVDEVRFAGVDPALASQDPGPAFHADGVLDVLVFEVHHLHAHAVFSNKLRLYADEGSHVVLV